MATIDNNIIQSLGAGSGIDTKNIVKQLVEIERTAPQGRIDTTRDKAEAQISDFGLLSSAMSTLADAAGALTEPEGLFSKSASFTESNALVPVGLDTDVQTGTYEFEVNAIAKPQSLISVGFSSVKDTVGEGTITFDFGSATVDGVDEFGDPDGTGKMTAFNVDAEATPLTITIDASNNSLEGLRDAINEADSGIQASIIYDGSEFVLQINAESGALNELQMTVEEAGGAPTNEDADGLSRFSFVAGAGAQMTQNQAGQDASLTVNGLAVTRETNNIDDIVEGLSLDVLKADPGVPVTITISDDKAFAEQTIRDFVEAYNLFLEAIEPAIGTYEEENEEGKSETIVGSLARDSLAKSVVSRIRSVISESIPGLSDTLFTSLGTSGIQTEIDGTLSIDEEKFSEVLEDNFEELQKLFAPRTASSTNDVLINSYGDTTTAGEYEVVITTQPRRAEYQGGVIGGISSTSGQTYSLQIDVNGVSSELLTLTPAAELSESEMASELQSLINSDANLLEGGASVIVEYNTEFDRFDITSTKYGSASDVAILDVQGSTEAGLGLTVKGADVAGQTVAGTINGVAGFGSANVLLPAIGEPGESLALIIGDDATSATVNFSRGFAGELEATLAEFLQSNGLINQREAVLERKIDKAGDDEEALERRMTAYQERLMNQFISMERILNGLNSSGGFLENLVDTLPFTSSNK